MFESGGGWGCQDSDLVFAPTSAEFCGPLVRYYVQVMVTEHWSVDGEAKNWLKRDTEGTGLAAVQREPDKYMLNLVFHWNAAVPMA